MSLPDRTTGLFAALVLLVALVANFGYLAIDRSLVMDDSPTYIGPARNLAQGNGFRNVYGLSETRRTPGYPLFLMPFMTLPNALVLVVLVQHLINAALAVGVYFLMLHVLGDAAAALAGGLFFAIDIPSVVHANMVVTETLFTALTFVVLAILSRRGIGAGATALAGFVASASVLVRPIALYVAIPLAIVIVAERRRGGIVRAFVFVICFAVLPLAWSARNAASGSGFTVSTITSWSLLFDRAAATLAIADPGDYGANLARRRNEFAREVGDPPQQATYSNHVSRSVDHFHVERYSPLALRIIARHPFAYLRAYALALGRTLFGGGARQLQDLAGLSPSRARMIILFYTCTTTLIALGGFFSLLHRDPHFARVSLAFVAYYLVACSMAEATSRFRVPVMPMIAVWFGCGLIAAIRWLRSRRQSWAVPA
jgi:hypothetical protein